MLRILVLTWATGGFYQAIQGYHFHSALYAGYKEGGALGALSVLNPLAGILTPAENATHEAIKGDYRAAGREGIKSLVAAVITVVTISIAPKPTAPGGKPPSVGGNSGTPGAPSTLKPGPYAGESIPARGPEKVFTPAEHHQINKIGRTNGCHTCGTTNPGTSLGR